MDLLDALVRRHKKLADPSSALSMAVRLLEAVDAMYKQTSDGWGGWHCPVRAGRTAAQAEGFVLLGEGHFSDVFWHGDAPGIVFKVSHRPNDGGLLYAAWCMGMYAEAPEKCRHYPHVHEMLRGEYTTIVVLEELEEREYAAADVANTVCEVMFNGAGSNDVAIGHTEMQALLRVVDTFADALDTSGDVHAGNIMFRADGTFVLTDPISSTEYKLKRTGKGTVPVLTL